MNEQELESGFHQLTARHIARCLSQLESVNMPSIVTETVKRELWYLSNDLKDLVMNEQGGQDNGIGKEERN